MADKNDSETFCSLCSKITQLFYRRTEGDRNLINDALKQLNSLNYRYAIVTNPTEAVLLINQFCSLIPAEDLILASKCCQLITNLVNYQNILVEGRTLVVVLQWCLQVLKLGDDKTKLSVLLAIDALLKSNCRNLNAILDIVMQKGALLSLTDDNSAEVSLACFQCLETCTTPNLQGECMGDKNLEMLKVCGDVLLKYCVSDKKFEDLTHSKILIVCLRGLQNIFHQNKDYLLDNISLVLGVIRSYMFYGIKDIEFLTPQKILPSSMSIPEPTSNIAREKKGGKVTKQRKHRTNKKPQKKEEESDNNDASLFNFSLDNSLNGSFLSQIKTSDSDFSDSEGGKIAKLNVTNGRLRQASLSLFLSVLKLVDKKLVFSYWANFIPENNTVRACHNLITCILKEPSARGRMAALNVLLYLLTSLKPYLLQAEASSRHSAFTTFSEVLSLNLIELHRSLVLALNENSVPVLTQVLKCLAALVQATPYHKMPPGLVFKLVRNLKGFLRHKDTTIQVGTLIVLGCLLASEPSIPETKESFLRHTSKALQYLDDDSNEEEIDSPQLFNDGSILSNNTNSADNSDISNKNATEKVDTSFGLNYNLLLKNPSFKIDPLKNDNSLPPNKDNISSIDEVRIPWLLEKCLYNLGVSLTDEPLVDPNIPAPLKLESVQTLSAMSRNYFDSLMLPHMNHITKAIELSLLDKYTDLRLHAGRCVDFIGQSMAQYLSNEDVKALDQGLLFWQTLLSGPLISLIQNEEHATLRAVGCDCLGSIGSYIFEHLSTDKKIFCITLLFGCSRDDENSVRGAAVRALAIWVLYPSMREDPGFIVDTTEAIFRSLKDDNIAVRIKASWSLGNLSDALVLNRSEGTSSEDLPNNWLMKLTEASIKASSGNDKIKMNTVRALGNLLQLITHDLMENPKYVEVIDKAIDCLIKSATSGSNMKVRWNSCYALGNILKNNALYKNNSWQVSVFNALSDLVKNFRNFKVRINASLALASPTHRASYGQFYHFTWTTLLEALENSQNMEDFSEYKHQDHLVEQICLGIGHLATLLNKEDLIHLHDNLTFYHDLLKTQMHRVLERLVPEKSSVLFSASFHIKSFSNTGSLTTEEIVILSRLKDIFEYEYL